MQAVQGFKNAGNYLLLLLFCVHFNRSQTRNLLNKWQIIFSLVNDGIAMHRRIRATLLYVLAVLAVLGEPQ